MRNKEANRNERETMRDQRLAQQQTDAAARYCIGCDQKKTGVRAYRVTNHEGQTERIEYCEDCADLGAMDWNGETAKIEVQ